MNRVSHGRIAMLDSGLGGLTVLSALRALRPDADVYYFADTAHVPLGDRSLAEIEEIGRRNVAHLMAYDPSAIVLACGSTCSAFDAFGAPELPVPLIGVVEPGSREAAAVSTSGRIGVTATGATIGSGVFERSILRARPAAAVTAVPAPALVPIIEAGEWDSERARRAVALVARPIAAARCDALILGCTHFPHVRNWFEEALGPTVILVDPAVATAREAAAALGTPTGAAGRLIVGVSGDAQAFAEAAARLSGVTIDELRHVAAVQPRHAAAEPSEQMK